MILSQEKNVRSLTGKETFINIRRKKFDMQIPIRCFSCGKPVAHLYEEFLERTSKGESAKKVLDDLGLKRYCCRALLLGHVDLIDMVAQFKKS